MKTMYLNDEQVKGIRTWSKNAQEYNDKLDVVLNDIRKQAKKEKNNDLVKALDRYWKVFKNDLFPHAMPHYRKNGTSNVIICDWVEKKGNVGMNLAFAEFRYIRKDTDGTMYREEATKLNACAGAITRKSAKPAKVVLTWPSGFKKEVNAYNENGDQIYEPTNTVFIPKEKSVWGHTDVVIDAFIEAADRLMGMIAIGELEK